ELLALVRSGAPNVRIVDVRWYLGRPGDGVATYAAGHLPGAIHLDLDDDVAGWVAARLWWMLDVLGHERVAVLDGGIAAWTAAGGELTTEVRTLPPAELHLADEWTRVIGRGELRRRLGEVVLLDARGVPRYRGEAEPVDPIAGHIPTARNAPVDGNLADGRFRTPAELAARFRE